MALFSRPCRRSALLSLLAALVTTFALAGPAGAATFTVTTTADGIGLGDCGTGGACTLRQAVNSANAAATEDVVNVQPAGTITLTAGEILIAKNSGSLAINGAAGGTTVDANLNSRVFLLDGLVDPLDVPAQVQLTALTITRGKDPDDGVTGEDGSGGGIFMRDRAALTLTNTTVTGNEAPQRGGGIEVRGGGTLTLANSAVTSNKAAVSGGGGIRLSGASTLIATNSTVSDNTASRAPACCPDGGGIFATGTSAVTLTGSTISGNTSQDDGGGIRLAGGSTLSVANSTISGNTSRGEENPSGGGGVHNSAGGAMTFVNTTISDNRALGSGAKGKGGGISRTSSAPMTFTNTTIANNSAAGDGGGIWASTEITFPITFKNTIVANNTAAGSGPNCVSSGTNWTSEGYNLTSDDRTGTSSCLFTSPTDLRNSDPKLGPLQANGGPTRTRALLEGSPAIDSASPDCPPPATDQRGVARPQRSSCDRGAFELEAAAAFNPDVPAVPGSPSAPAQPVTPAATPPAQPQPPPDCRDRRAPITTLKRSALKGSGEVRISARSALTLKGRARDHADCPSGLRRVQVSLARVKGRTGVNCRFIKRPDRFVLTGSQNCRRPVLFSAVGTDSWKFTFPVALEPGLYRAQARGTDKAGNKETPKKGRNIVFFEVR